LLKWQMGTQQYIKRDHPIQGLQNQSLCQRCATAY